MSSLDHLIGIRSWGSLSALGADRENVWNRYRSGRGGIRVRTFRNRRVPVAPLDPAAEEIVDRLVREDRKNRKLDRSVILAMAAAEAACRGAGWGTERRIGINIGSSRGATMTLEKAMTRFTNTDRLLTSPLTSPTTTLGNISTNVARHVSTRGPVISHSITCSTSLQAVANAMAWIRSGMADRFLVGGAEAALTDFTVAQMVSLGIYSGAADDEYPCRPLGTDDRNTFVLGEGAAVFALEGYTVEELEKSRPLAVLESIGNGFSSAPTSTGISDDGGPLIRSMTEAIDNSISDEPIDLVVLHAPGTRAGDRAELTAIRTVLGDAVPDLHSNKWAVGHAFGAAAALSMEFALLCLLENEPVEIPYPTTLDTGGRRIQKVMVNATGFGGNACSVILSLPELSLAKLR